MAAFITPAQFFLYADIRRVCEYCSDTKIPIPENEIATNPVLLELLDAGAQDIISACILGKRYSLQQLADYANDLVNGQPLANVSGSKLRRLNAQLSWGLVVDRRKFAVDDFNKLCPTYVVALKDVELLRLGERIFSMPGPDEAGLPDHTQLGSDACGVIGEYYGLWGSAADRPHGFNGPGFTSLNPGYQ